VIIIVLTSCLTIRYEGKQISRMTPKLDLEQYRVEGLPPTAYYIPNFITEHEEEYLLQKVSRC
jgi:hypothetical protein